MDKIDGTSWRKSSYSTGNGGNCVEVGEHANRVLVRDTTHRSGGTLAFSTSAWKMFTAQVKASLTGPEPMF
jgi:hypothetical protein